MSDQSQGPGWWLASDGKWYPPQPPATPPTPSTPSAEPPQLAADAPTTHYQPPTPSPTPPPGDPSHWSGYAPGAFVPPPMPGGPVGQAGPAGPVSPTTAPEEKKSAALIIGLIVLAVVLIGGGLAFALTRPKDDLAATSSTTTSTAAPAATDNSKQEATTTTEEKTETSKKRLTTTTSRGRTTTSNRRTSDAITFPLPRDPAGAIADAGLPELPEEGVEVHYHAHVDIEIDGIPVIVAANVGITSNSISPLHTHDITGMIHIESDVEDIFTLGQFFIEWDVELSDSCIATYCAEDGTVLLTFVNGELFLGDPADIVFQPHDEIFIWLGSENATPDIVSTYDFPPGA